MFRPCDGSSIVGGNIIVGDYSHRRLLKSLREYLLPGKCGPF